MTDRMDSRVNHNGKIVIGVPGKRPSPHAGNSGEQAGGLFTNDIQDVLDLIKPDPK